MSRMMSFSRMPSSLRARLALLLFLAIGIAFSIWRLYPDFFTFGNLPMSHPRYGGNYLRSTIADSESPDTDCLINSSPTSIEGLEKAIEVLKSSRSRKCRHFLAVFNSIYHLRAKLTEIVISDSFMTKVRSWLQDNKILIERTKKQNILFVDNIVTQESVVFNPVRAMRPGASSGNEAQVLQHVLESSKQSCDFCNYKSFAAQDTFGILESKHASMVSNTFKIEKYHGLLLFKEHNPLEFSLEQFTDAMHLALRWFEKTHSIVPSHTYRFMYWDMLSKSSASQIHSHIHTTLGDSYYAKWNHLHLSALSYAKQHNGENYWSNLIAIHHILGLSVDYGKATAMAYLTPQKDYEVLVICNKPTEDYFKLLYFVYRAFIDDLQLYALSSGFVLPELNANTEDGSSLPAITRIVYRGSLTTARSDISSFDLFGTPNVNKDPFIVIKAVKNSITKREGLV